MTQNRTQTDREVVSELTTGRLSVYLRCLSYLESIHQETVSSAELAERFHLNSAQIRKDLACFGRAGMTARLTTAELAVRLERIMRRFSFDQRNAIRTYLALRDPRWDSADERRRLAMVRNLEKALERHVAQQATTDTTAPAGCDPQVREKAE